MNKPMYSHADICHLLEQNQQRSNIRYTLQKSETKRNFYLYWFYKDNTLLSSWHEHVDTVAEISKALYNLYVLLNANIPTQ